MRPPRAMACVLPFVALACGSTPSDGFVSTMGPAITSLPADTTPAGSTAADPASTSGDPGSTTADPSTTGDPDSTSAPASTGTVYDLGSNPDLGPLQPPGCKDKIDFLFVMQRRPQLPATQEKIIAAFPAFIKTIQEKFAGFDVHIMVTDTDWQWGLDVCEEKGCPNTDNNGCEIGDNFSIPDYPCGAYPELMQDECYITLGAGVIFNAGQGAANVPCKIDGDRRYITQDQTDLAETFACMAQVGQSGGDRVGRAMAEAVSPALNAEGGCNAGFLRDDALLMITWVATGDDQFSEGTPKDWAEAVFDAKYGNKDAVVMLGIGGVADSPPSAKVLKLLTYFPHSLREYITADSYGPAFAKAVTLVDEACQSFTPPG